MSAKRELEEWFAADAAGRRWDDMYGDRAPRPEEDSFRQRRDYAVGLVAHLPPEARILDLGCGAGVVMVELLARGRRVVGLDYSPDMLRFAAERLHGRGLDRTPLLRGDAGRLPFPDGAFDAVLCLGVISYQEDYGPVLREIRRVLVPGGLALITFRNVFNPVASDPVKAAKALARFVLRGQPPRDSGMGRYLHPGEVERDIAQAGLRCERFEAIGLGPFRFAGRRLLGDRASVAMSRRLSAVLKRTGLGWVLRWSADVAMFVCRRP